jgi:hypothetical protein
MGARCSDAHADMSPLRIIVSDVFETGLFVFSAALRLPW